MSDPKKKLWQIICALVPKSWQTYCYYFIIGKTSDAQLIDAFEKIKNILK